MCIVSCETMNDLSAELKLAWRLQQIYCPSQILTEISEDNYAINASNSYSITSPAFVRKCGDSGIILPELKFRSSEDSRGKLKDSTSKTSSNSIFTVTKDGIYSFSLEISSNIKYNAFTRIEFKEPYGYLSASDWPLLPFYGAMCFIYVSYGLSWLLISFMQWRDLLRIQFWIGGVILLGMIEKAVFFAEYQNVNITGIPIHHAELIAEWISCAKRTLARILVIIVSLGFGIVKPRLGPMCNQLAGTGVLYFLLACIEGYLRVMQIKNDKHNPALVASIPLAIIDSAICWWIFTSLLQTTRTLQLRRNTIKLTLYRHFTNMLIFSILASVVFIIYVLKINQLNKCSMPWREMWIENAFWHCLFSVLLLVIMVLWRPTKNNQRYAFTPLLDNPEDENDEEERLVADSLGVKMRSIRHSEPKVQSLFISPDDDLRWVEENIPLALHTTNLPIVDSDDELMKRKFEASKMQ